MNFIQRLQQENAELRQQLQAAKQRTTDFMTFLLGPKFTGTENGERKDWIATGDVQTWLSDHRTSLFTE